MTAILLYSGLNFLLISPAYVTPVLYTIINVLTFLLAWVLTAALIDRFSVYRVLFLAATLLSIAVTETYVNVRHNPLTIPLLILFWLGGAYMVVPRFFRKYQIFILATYGFVLSHHLIVFLTTPDYTITDRVRSANFMLSPVPVFAALWIYEQWRWLRTLQAEKAKTELALLKSHVNPHFFFNTLNNLYGLTVEKSDDAPRVVLKLSDMMRYTIYEGKEETVALADEVAYLENYVELHKIRYRKEVDISFVHDIEDGIRIAPLLFIILLENAFKHGVEKLRDQAFIRSSLKTQGNQLFFMIENNYDPSAIGHRPGIGLDNLKRRLDHLYPNRYDMEVTQTADVYAVQLNITLG